MKKLVLLVVLVTTQLLGQSYYGQDYSASDPNNPYVPIQYGTFPLPAVGQSNAFQDSSFSNSNMWRLTGFPAIAGTGQDSGPGIDALHRYVYISPLDSTLATNGSAIIHLTGAATTADISCTFSFGATYQGWWGMNNVVRAGGNAWNDQDLFYIADGATSQIVRVNIPLCEADASRTASIGKSYVEVWDTLTGSDSNPYTNLNVCFHGGGLTTDGNHICLSDNKGDGVANDPRMYTIGAKNSGTFGASWAGLGYYTISSLTCSGSGTTSCALVTTGSPNYPQYTGIHSNSTNCGSKYWYISAVTDANTFTVIPFTGTHTVCTDVAGYTVQNLRSAQIVPINNSWGVALRQRVGDVASGRPTYNELYNTSTGAFIKIVTTTHVHSAYYANAGNYYLFKSVNSGGTPAPPAGCTTGFFSINFTDLSTACFPATANTYPIGDVYMNGYPTIYGPSTFPYVIVSTIDDYQTDGWPIGIGDRTWAAGSVTTSAFRETDATTTGQCSGPGGGALIAYCGWDSGTVTHYSVSTTSIPWRSDYVNAWDINRNTGTHGTFLMNNEVWMVNIKDSLQPMRHLGHHRTLAVEQTLSTPRGPFNSLAHVNGDFDGTYIVFDSSWGNSGQVYPFIAQVTKTSTPTISPAFATIPVNGTQQFSATVSSTPFFSSGFEGTTLHATSACSSSNCFTGIDGTDSVTGYAWPPNLWGSTNLTNVYYTNARGTSVQEMPDSGPSCSQTIPAADIGHWVDTQLQTVTGHTGSSTTALFQHTTTASTAYNGTTCDNTSGSRQDPLLFLPDTGNVAQGDLYYSAWMRLQDNIQNFMTGTGSGTADWETLFEWKTGGKINGTNKCWSNASVQYAGDLRQSLYVVHTTADGYYFQFKEDNNANGDMAYATSNDIPISTISRTSNVVTVVTSSAHGFTTGNTVAIVDVSDATFNGLFTSITVDNTTTFHYSQTASNGASSGGAAAQASIGLHNFWIANDTAHTIPVPSQGCTATGCFNCSGANCWFHVEWFMHRALDATSHTWVKINGTLLAENYGGESNRGNYGIHHCGVNRFVPSTAYAGGDFDVSRWVDDMELWNGVSSVSWSTTCGSVSPASGSSTFFTAPANPTTCTITGGTATAQAIVQNPVVTPATASLNVGGTQQFTANFPGTWTATGGTITSSGLYTAPALNGTYTITFTATNGGATATASVTVTGQLTTIPLSITPLSWSTSTTISTTVSQTFTATNIGTGSVTPTVTFTGPAPFTKSADTCNATPVAGSGTCHVTIQFNSALVGAYSATLTITDTAGGATTIPISVSIPTGTVVNVSPQTATIPINGTQQFSVSTSNGSTVTWAATCGTLSGTQYTAPATPNICTITATATDGSGSTGTAIVTAVSVAVNPSAVTLQINSSQQFTVNVASTWTATCGFVSSSGFYTAPGSPSSCTVTAHASNGGATGSATVAVVNPPPGTRGGSQRGGKSKWKVFH